MSRSNDLLALKRRSFHGLKPYFGEDEYGDGGRAELLTDREAPTTERDTHLVKEEHAMRPVLKISWMFVKWSILVGLLLCGVLVWMAKRSIPKPGEAASWSPRF